MSTIILACPVRTGSTLLMNALYGLLRPGCAGKFIGSSDSDWNIKENDIIKTHILDFNRWEQYSKQTNIKFYYISCERSDINHIISRTQIPEDILIFQYEELLETKEYTLCDIVDNIFNKIKVFLPDTYSLNKEACLERLIGMNKIVEILKDEPFSYWDKFYLIHGSHRNRDGLGY